MTVDVSQLVSLPLPTPAAPGPPRAMATLLASLLVKSVPRDVLIIRHATSAPHDPRPALQNQDHPESRQPVVRLLPAPPFPFGILTAAPPSSPLPVGARQTSFLTRCTLSIPNTPSTTRTSPVDPAPSNHDTLTALASTVVAALLPNQSQPRCLVPQTSTLRRMKNLSSPQRIQTSTSNHASSGMESQGRVERASTRMWWTIIA